MSKKPTTATKQLPKKPQTPELLYPLCLQVSVFSVHCSLPQPFQWHIPEVLLCFFLLRQISQSLICNFLTTPNSCKLSLLICKIQHFYISYYTCAAKSHSDKLAFPMHTKSEKTPIPVKILLLTLDARIFSYFFFSLDRNSLEKQWPLSVHYRAEHEIWMEERNKEHHRMGFPLLTLAHIWSILCMQLLKLPLNGLLYFCWLKGWLVPFTSLKSVCNISSGGGAWVAAFAPSLGLISGAWGFIFSFFFFFFLSQSSHPHLVSFRLNIWSLDNIYS